MDSTPHPETEEERKGIVEGVTEESGIRVEGRGDLWLGGILTALSVGIIILSLQMPRPAGWLSAPGIFPLFSAFILLGLSVGLLCMRLRAGPIIPAVRSQPVDRAEKRLLFKRGVVVAFGVLTYVFLLIPTVHFRFATFIYLVGTLWYFWGGSFYKILLISLVATLFLSEMFTWFFQIMLP
jgi:hypothetical protein